MILIGVENYDMEGKKRLEYLLNKIRPRVITIQEPSNFTIAEIENRIIQRRREYLDATESVDLLEKVKEFITEFACSGDFESHTAIQYGKVNNVPIFPVQYPQSITPMEVEDPKLHVSLFLDLNRYPDINSIPYEVLRNAVIIGIDYHYRRLGVDREHKTSEYVPNSPDLSKIIQSLDARRKAIFLDQLYLLKTKEQYEIEEQAMADEITKRNPDVHIGGLIHIFDTGVLPFPPLYRRLGSLVSERIRLCDAFDWQPK